MCTWYKNKDFWDRMSPKLFNKLHWNIASEEIEHIITLTGIQPGSSVLDLCCGPGRHSLELARKGYKVTAVDLTSAYIEEAAAKSKSEGISIEFVNEDMKNFNRPGCFHAIMIMYTSFGYFEDQQENIKVLNNCFHSLIEGGSLIIDLMGKEIVAKIFREREWHEEDGAFYLEERSVLNDWSKIHNRWIMIKGKEKHEFNFTHWLYSASELKDLLLKSGFSSVKVYGKLDGRKYDNQAERLIAVAKK